MCQAEIINTCDFEIKNVLKVTWSRIIALKLNYVSV